MGLFVTRGPGLRNRQMRTPEECAVIANGIVDVLSTKGRISETFKQSYLGMLQALYWVNGHEFPKAILDEFTSIPFELAAEMFLTDHKEACEVSGGDDGDIFPKEGAIDAFEQYISSLESSVRGRAEEDSGSRNHVYNGQRPIPRAAQKGDAETR